MAGLVPRARVHGMSSAKQQERQLGPGRNRRGRGQAPGPRGVAPAAPRCWGEAGEGPGRPARPRGRGRGGRRAAQRGEERLENLERRRELRRWLERGVGFLEPSETLMEAFPVPGAVADSGHMGAKETHPTRPQGLCDRGRREAPKVGRWNGLEPSRPATEVFVGAPGRSVRLRRQTSLRDATLFTLSCMISSALNGFAEEPV